MSYSLNVLSVSLWIIAVPLASWVVMYRVKLGRVGVLWGLWDDEDIAVVFLVAFEDVPSCSDCFSVVFWMPFLCNAGCSVVVEEDEV